MPTHDNRWICRIGEERDIPGFRNGIDSTEFDVQPARRLDQTNMELRNVLT